MLPDIRVSLPVLFALWCGVGVWVMGGPVLLAYPAMWAGVAALFYAATKAFPATPAGSE